MDPMPVSEVLQPSLETEPYAPDSSINRIQYLFYTSSIRRQSLSEEFEISLQGVHGKSIGIIGKSNVSKLKEVPW